ncbi:MAG: RNB domain-containing ribonuclease [Pirellulales bacterium]
MSDLTTTILAYVNEPSYRPGKPRIIAKNLGLEERRDEVKAAIKQLIKSGQLAYGAQHHVLPVADGHAAIENVVVSAAVREKPKNDHNHVTGTLRRVSSGDGYVRPTGTLASAGRDADIYVAAKNAGDSASGDIVRVRLEKRGRMGKFEGRVIDVIERATNRFVGTYFEQAGMGLVQVDGKVFTSAIFVGDPGAKGVQPDDKVVIELVRFPSHSRDGEGVITEVLGKRGQAGVDTMSIIYEFGLPGDFAEDTLEGSRRQATQFDEAVVDGRQDLTGEVIVTIDPVDARDFDDAISLTRAENGHWLLGVHIADVSHFVQEKTPLDREAYDRATSVYLPDRVIPMLPEIISNNLASLQPHKVRYAMTCRIELTTEGTFVGADVYKSAIKSRRRFTYEEVDEFLAEKGLVKASAVSHLPPPPSAGERLGEGAKSRRKTTTTVSAKTTGVVASLTHEVDALLGRMHELAMILRARRFTRGALELSMPELKIDLDKDGRVVGAHKEVQTESHQIIEEFMLAANEAVAERLARAGLIFLRRVHGNPDPRKLKLLTQFVQELGVEAENLENRFELQKLLDAMKGDPREHAVNFAVLRSMQRAIYSPEEEGHYALASDCYCHFTSPIRRYPDLTIHRLLEALNTSRKPVQSMELYLQMGDHCSEREQRATNAERELNKVKLLNYLSDKIGMELQGVITGVENFGLFITGVELPAEGFVHITALSDDYYRFERSSHTISGFRSGNQYRLGDAVRVAVAAVDVDARELDFRLVGRAASTQAATRPTKRTAKAGRSSTKKPGKPRKRGR